MLYSRGEIVYVIFRRSDKKSLRMNESVTFHPENFADGSVVVQYGFSAPRNVIYYKSIEEYIKDTEEADEPT